MYIQLWMISYLLNVFYGNDSEVKLLGTVVNLGNCYMHVYLWTYCIYS